VIEPNVGGQYFAPGSGAVIELDRPPADRSTQQRRFSPALLKTSSAWGASDH